MSVRSEWSHDPAAVLDAVIEETRLLVDEVSSDRPNDKRALKEIIRHLKAAKAASRPLYKGTVT